MLAVSVFTVCAWGKNIKIVVIPTEATIKVNGSYYGEGSAVLKIKKNDFVSLECSCPGYETLNTRIYGNDDRKTIEVKLKEDMLLQQTSESSVANNFFSVKVNKNLYSDDPETVKESNIGGDLTFQIKMTSEIAPIQGRSREESFLETNRIMKEFESLVSEFQARLGEK